MESQNSTESQNVTRPPRFVRGFLIPTDTARPAVGKGGRSSGAGSRPAGESAASGWREGTGTRGGLSPRAPGRAAELSGCVPRQSGAGPGRDGDGGPRPARQWRSGGGTGTIITTITTIIIAITMRGAVGILILCLVPAAALDFRYHHSEELEQFLKGVHAAYPALTHLHSIGRSVEGRDLWVLVLGRFPTHHKIGIPEFKYVANMHGDETVGREILLHLIDLLVTSYGRDPVITRLLNHTRIHIMPTMNPDGFEATKVPDCYYTRGRYNKNGEDLNRNFPDAFENNSARIQPETRAVMDWIKNETFVLSANLHGGALVASYTFDNGNPVTGSLKGYSRSPDDDVFIHLAKTYSSNHASMYKGTGCDNRQTFPEGITNGYSWYQLEGGMQDYNYVWGQCFEITLELSCCKYPPAEQLEKFWRDNKVALIEYIKQVHLGVKGQVTDKNGNPIPNAIVEAKGRPHVCPYRTNEQGEYFLLLLPGTYVINATVPGFKSMLKTVEIPDNTGNFSALKQDFSFPEVSDQIRSKVASCPKIPLYQELARASAAVKPTVHILVLMTTMLVIFK